MVKHALARLRNLLQGRDKGTVALTFLLSLPILIALIGIIVQWALVANARLSINRAANAAARTAMTVLPTDPLLERGGPDMVRRSALIVLAGLSPASPESATSDSQEVAQALQDCGLTLPDRYALRYSHADQGTTLTIAPTRQSLARLDQPDTPAGPRGRDYADVQIPADRAWRNVCRPARNSGRRRRLLPHHDGNAPRAAFGRA